MSMDACYLQVPRAIALIPCVNLLMGQFFTTRLHGADVHAGFRVKEVCEGILLSLSGTLLLYPSSLSIHINIAIILY
ncbi:hypothetical protein EV426DRAFT_616590 [Tirmania nivea]|nr:hypothetical protein EV426DRAFT_616590 [Tirmania nivea]